MTKANHTIVLSDLHLADAEPAHPKNPFWKRFKRPKLFIDRQFKKFLDFICSHPEVNGPVELVLNGDIFDFDSVTKLPNKGFYQVSWIEKRRGLHAEEGRSRFKMSVIMEDHKVWMQALQEFVLAGNYVVIIVGNHDVELQWPSVQQDFINQLDLSEGFKENVRFCEWFYISNEDTLIEHGNQYDPFCVRSNPIHPLIKKGSKIFIRIPFGNLASRFLTNGIGLINPHADANFLMGFKEYLVIFYKYWVRTQPLVFISWFWGAIATLSYSIIEELLPELKDPMTVENRVEEIATRSNATPYMVRSLFALKVHSATFNPLKIMRELWLDRAFLFLLICFVSFQFFTFIRLFFDVSFLWLIVPFFLLFPVFVFYSHSVKSDLVAAQKMAIQNAPLAAQMTKVNRVIHGHTHAEMHILYQGIELINTGTWSPAYLDIECTKPYGKKCFAWIKPNALGSGREALLGIWEDPTFSVLPAEKREEKA